MLELICSSDRSDYRIVEYASDDRLWLKTFGRDDIYTLVQAGLSDTGPQRVLVRIHAGGGYGARSDGMLFQRLCTSTWRFDYGGPWARVSPDGLVSYGWRLVIPSDIIDGESIAAFGFILGMVENLGAVSRQLANELIPWHGGRLLNDRDPESFRHLLASVLPPANI